MGDLFAGLQLLYFYISLFQLIKKISLEFKEVPIVGSYCMKSVSVSACHLKREMLINIPV
jgi:hypothetical protein